MLAKTRYLQILEQQIVHPRKADYERELGVIATRIAPLSREFLYNALQLIRTLPERQQ